MRKILPAIAVVCVFATACFAQTSIKAETNRAGISTDEILQYTVTIVTDERRLPPPVFPELKDFQVISTSQSSAVSLSGQGMKSTLAYVFILLPREAGTFTIPPATITLAGKRLSSGPITIKVTQGRVRGRRAAPPATPPRQLPDLGNEPQYEL